MDGSLTIVSAKSKIYSPRRGYLTPGNFIILEIAATVYYSSASQFFADFGAHFVETQARFRKTLFIFVNLPCLQGNAKNILPYHISTLSSKIQYTIRYDNSQRQKISQNPFPAKHFIERNNIRCTKIPTESTIERR